MPRLIVVSGTGTEIGKTHVTEALLRRAARSRIAVGYKPVESGAGGSEGEDGRRLGAAGTFHVKQPQAYVLRKAVAPHVAARDEGVRIDVARIVAAVRSVRDEVAHAERQGARPADRSGGGAAWTDGGASPGDASEQALLFVELPGGLFSPVAEGLLNAELAHQLMAELGGALLLIAPDRLGVMHDVIATTHAAESLALTPAALALNAPASPDASTGTNAAELARYARHEMVTLPRGPAPTLAERAEVDRLVGLLSAGSPGTR